MGEKVGDVYKVSEREWVDANRESRVGEVVQAARDALGKKVPSIWVGNPEGLNQSGSWKVLLQSTRNETVYSSDFSSYETAESARSGGYRKARKNERYKLAAVYLIWTAGTRF